MDAELERELQAERIRSRQDWVRYVELKTSLYRTHVAQVDDELAAIRDALWRHERVEPGAHQIKDSPRPGAARPRPGA